MFVYLSVIVDILTHEANAAKLAPPAWHKPQPMPEAYMHLFKSNRPAC